MCCWATTAAAAVAHVHGRLLLLSQRLLMPQCLCSCNFLSSSRSYESTSTAAARTIMMTCTHKQSSTEHLLMQSAMDISYVCRSECKGRGTCWMMSLSQQDRYPLAPYDPLLLSLASDSMLWLFQTSSCSSPAQGPKHWPFGLLGT